MQLYSDALRVRDEEKNPVDLKSLGWNSFYEGYCADDLYRDLTPARVTEELKGFQRVRAADGEYLAEIAGRVRHLAEDRDDLPAVGDWVGIAPRPNEGRARIEAIFPRRTKLSRKVAGRVTSEQIVAANIDTVFVVSSLNHDLNVRRIERYLAIVWNSGARPVILLNKADLCADAAALAAEVEFAAPGVAVHTMSAAESNGLGHIYSYLKPGETAALIGSSGVGKTTIINALLAETLDGEHVAAASNQLRVQSVREGDDRGRHTTTSRQMIFLPSGGILIDTPGMREIQLWDSEEGVDKAFEDIERLFANCRFRDCGHTGERGCAVETAILNGELDRSRFENYRKLEAELNFQRRKNDPEYAREVKEKWKQIHKAARKKGNRY
ncbi:MAG TPA: ribosome small subunit-dependent GTPase A [Candidatus Acidoferrales bacterium]|nr:ribosome small subunit-dependent GTPase A [Candidatus Acidoferrales bacterium]